MLFICLYIVRGKSAEEIFHTVRVRYTSIISTQKCTSTQKRKNETIMLCRYGVRDGSRAVTIEAIEAAIQ